jgi:hypothetical protein
LTLFVCLLAASPIPARYQAGTQYIGVAAPIVTEPVGCDGQYTMGCDEHIGPGILVRYRGQEAAKVSTRTGTAALERQTFAPGFHTRSRFLPEEMIAPLRRSLRRVFHSSETGITEGILTLPKSAERAGCRYFQASHRRVAVFCQSQHHAARQTRVSCGRYCPYICSTNEIPAHNHDASSQV